MRITVCGGGNLGHVCAAFLSGESGQDVTVLTRHPEKWLCDISCSLPDGTSFTGHLSCVTDDAELAVSSADVVLICLPGFSIAEELRRIKPFLSKSCYVGSVVSSTGFFDSAFAILSEQQPIFGFQRVPFISRTEEYGRSVHLLGFKRELFVAVENTLQQDKERFISSINGVFGCPVRLLSSYFEAALSNSNPLLHTARLYSLFRDWDGGLFDRQILFYGEWTDFASSVYLAMDSELHDLISNLGLRTEMLPTVLEYYESQDVQSLTKKIRSIEAFKTIVSPLKLVGDGFVPDFGSRYFTEDFPFGLDIIRKLCHEHGVRSDVIDEVCAWGVSVIEKL